MRFNKQIWTRWDLKKPCPTCVIGTLEVPRQGGFLRNETAESQEMNSLGAYYHTTSVFSTHLKCNNCQESVAVSGVVVEDNSPTEHESELQKFVTPVIFYPALQLIYIPESC